MEKKTIDALIRPFDKKDIKQRQGGFGKTLDYVEGHRVIQRLNEAFNYQWSFEVISTEVKDGFVIAKTRITVHDYDSKNNPVVIIKEGIGSKQIMKKRGTDIILDLGSDKKSATTDSLKKSATLFGIALDLYGVDEKEEVAAKETEAVEEHKEVVGPVTEGQKKAITKMSESKNVSLEKLLSDNKLPSFDKLTEVDGRKVIALLNNITVG